MIVTVVMCWSIQSNMFKHYNSLEFRVIIVLMFHDNSINTLSRMIDMCWFKGPAIN